VNYEEAGSAPTTYFEGSYAFFLLPSKYDSDYNGEESVGARPCIIFEVEVISPENMNIAPAPTLHC
jgi:hypothetical protein